MPIYTAFFSAAGGQTCSSTAAAYALGQAKAGRHILLVDCRYRDNGSDLCAILGVPNAYDDQQVNVIDGLDLVFNPEIADYTHDEVVYDFGTDFHLMKNKDFDRTFLVTKCCYISLRRAVGLNIRPTGIIVHRELGRALDVRDVERAIGVPCAVETSEAPIVARAIDAGLLATRLPQDLLALAALTPATV